jgi:hypothetical protein
MALFVRYRTEARAMKKGNEWRGRAAALRENAKDPAELDVRQTLLMLADDCDQIAREIETTSENDGSAVADSHAGVGRVGPEQKPD